ncbi:50S ribosomal protein L25/general stress protein Ctc [bacterium]|nr:50S ribosomal protein L25/general stress protein Ctc [bacterium]
MEKIEFTAEIREGKGKKITRKLRQNDYIPAILYGYGIEPLLLKLKRKGTERIIRHLESHNVMGDLLIEKNGKKEKVKVVLKEVQVDPVKERILHLDFYQVRMDKPITLTVPLHFTGEAPGIEKGGILDEEMREVTIECLPKDVPDFIKVDISSLDIGETLLVKDIKTDEKIKILEDEEKVVVSILAPKVVEVEEEEEEEVKEEPEVITEEKAEERRKEKEEK